MACMYEPFLEASGLFESVAVNKLVRAAGVLLSPILTSGSSAEAEGSSTSFSTLEKRALRDGKGVSGCCWLGRRIWFMPGVVKADNGRVELDGGGELMEAWAVFMEIEEVGGPEEKMERPGVLKSGGVCEGDRFVISSSGAECAFSLDDALRGNNVGCLAP